jgi:malate dehydrogenase (oxaloacetate-decarboxylating)(NADP+)
MKRENVWVTDLAGVVYEGRTELMDEDKIQYAQKTTDARTLAEVIEGADVFLGLSAGGVLKPDMVAQDGARPLIFALANPNPEILPEEVKAVRDDAIMATGRSDYPQPGQQRPVLPLHLPRGAGLRCHHHHDGDGNRRGARHRRAGPGRAKRGGGAAYAGEPLAFGPRIPDSQAV